MSSVYSKTWKGSSGGKWLKFFHRGLTPRGTVAKGTLYGMTKDLPETPAQQSLRAACLPLYEAMLEELDELIEIERKAIESGTRGSPQHLAAHGHLIRAKHELIEAISRIR